MDELEAESKPGKYPNLDDIIVEDGPTLLLPCIVCNKTFKPEVLQRHSKVCEKNTHKRRKTFDSFKQRVQGTDLAEFLPYSTLQKRPSVSEKTTSPLKASSHWKENHEAFVNAIRAARGEGPDAAGGSGDSRSVLRPPDHEQCPYCERHFGKKAFDRHQEWCREQHSRHPPIIASSQAKERLEARIKYRAPPIKSKRAITREKYSPLVQRKARNPSPSNASNYSYSTAGSATSSAGSTRHSPQSQQEQSNRLSRSGNSLSGRSQVKDTASTASTLGFNRGNAGRSSLRTSQRSSNRPTSPTKRLPGGTKLPASPSQRPSPDESRVGSTNREDMTVTSTSLKKLQSRNQLTKQHDARVSETPIAKPLKKHNQPSPPALNLQTLQIEVQPKEAKENVHHSKTKNEHLWRTLLGGHILPNMYSLKLSVGGKRIGSQQEEPYDPYASAERQMMELLRSDSACNINQKLKSPSPAPSLSPMPSPTLSPKPSSLETSPTSAFTRYAKELEAENQSPVNSSVNAPETETVEKSCDGSKVVLSKKEAKSASEMTEKAKPFESPRLQQVAQPNVKSPKGLGQAGQVPHPAPQPPPRLNKRSSSLPQSNNYDDLIVSGIGTTRPQLQSGPLLDFAAEDFNSTKSHDLNERPKTYDIDKKSAKDSLETSGWLNACEQLESVGNDFPPAAESSHGVKVEILNLDNKDDRKARHETRESREIREITEKESDTSEIDNLLEEVVRMQHSVSMLSDADPVNVRDSPSLSTNPSSARSRRNRAGKMHIEDFLFPAELLERENNNFRTSMDSSARSNSVFGSTKSRKSSAKGRRLIEEMLFPPGIDFNANSDSNEDGDVVVSANALTVSYPEEFMSKMDAFMSQYPTSPVSLTSKAPNSSDHNDGLPRPKPMSLSTHSSTRNGCNEGIEIDASSTPMSPMQATNQSRQSNSSRLSADSAYSSLNRRSPVPQARRQFPVGMQDVRHGAESPQSMLSQSLTQSLVLSSSGSESSLPPLSNHLSKRGVRSKDCDTPSSDIVSATTPLLPKLSKFCHQCGTKFLVSLAKFCHECGAARLEIC
ncbi:uncharacterized protein LOC117639055 isoform X2 [Thrips palmi]|uniref:Uncharacterized protein LOC117639055 isoform X2 n=1 Tax=Thrips palmi TaxID=161013 RepID=A0A6P8Y230_THRPL|nr:uncharacterized protein LOC117639055 isoform X2 [Thrips palmi]